MKSITIIFALLLAGVYAVSIPNVPEVQDERAFEGRNPRFVGDLISSALEELSADIREAGLDPWVFDRAGLDYELPVPVLLSINAVVENIQFTGLSDIVINHINFGFLSGVLTLDISLPQISLYIGNVSLDAVALGADINILINGRLSLIEPRISGEVVLNLLGVIVGPLIRSMDLEFRLEGIQYNGRMNLFGMELTEQFTNFVTVSIPNAIQAHTEEINELVEIIARQLIEDII